MKDVAGMQRTVAVVGRVSLIVALCGVFGVTGCGSSGGGSGGGGTGGGGGLSGGTPLVSGGAKDLYVMQLSSSGDVASILDFAADSGGSLKPRSTLVPPAGFEVESIATDSDGQIYLGGINTATTVYEGSDLRAGSHGVGVSFANGQLAQRRKRSIFAAGHDGGFFRTAVCGWAWGRGCICGECEWRFKCIDELRSEL